MVYEVFLNFLSTLAPNANLAVLQAYAIAMSLGVCVFPFWLIKRLYNG